MLVLAVALALALVLLVPLGLALVLAVVTVPILTWVTLFLVHAMATLAAARADNQAG